ncbi:MAG: hypothetical protein V4467_02685 [Patescibacteria group bacterium]
MGLREKLLAAGAEKLATQEQEATSIRERLVREAKEKEAASVRMEIAALTDKKAKLEAALADLEASYTELAHDRSSLKTGRREVAQKKAGKESSERKIVALLDVLTPREGETREDQMLREALQARGLTTAEQIIAHPEFQDDPDVVGLKRGEVEVTTSKEALKPKKRALVDKYLGEEVAPATEADVPETKKKRVGGARVARQAVKEAIPEIVEGGENFSFAGKNRPESVKKLKAHLKVMQEEIGALELKTPEGQAELKKRFERFYANRFQDKNYFVRAERGVPRNFVDQSDIADAEKYGVEVIKGTLKEQVQARLATEVEKAKGTVGVVKAKNDVVKIESSEQKLEPFIGRVHVLERKRQEVLAALKAKEKDVAGLIRHYFGDESSNGRGFQPMLKSDPTRAWLYYLEKFSCQFLLEATRDGGTSDETIRRGVPAVMLEFLQKKRGDSFNSKDPVASMFDTESFEKGLVIYEQFLNEVSNIVTNQPESIAGSERRSGSDAMVLADKFRDASKLNPYQSVRIESEQVMASVNAGRSLDQIKKNIQEAEKPFDQARKERGEYLDRLVDKEWAEEEEKAFSRAHSETADISQKAERIRVQKEVAQELSPLVLKARTSLLSGEFGPDKTSGEFQISLDREGYPRVTHTEYDSASQEYNTAQKELELLKNKILENERQERPRKWFGEKPLDVELKRLKADQPIKAERFAAAEQRYNAIDVQTKSVYTAFSELHKLIPRGGFEIDSNPRPLPEFIDMLQRISNEASSATLSPEEQKIFNEFIRLRRKTTQATVEVQGAKGISRDTIEKLRELRYGLT